MAMADFDSLEDFRNNLTWGSMDGRKTLVKDLTNEHLVNILNWVRERPRQYSPSLYPLLEREANYRKLIAFTENVAIPVKCEDGRWVTMLNGEATNLASDMTVNGKVPYEDTTS